MTKETLLIMLSGGLDSTYLLKKALTESDDDVLVHHVHLINPEERHRAEERACKEIRAYCAKTFRSFHYSESTVMRNQLKSFFGFDVMTAAFEAGIASSNYTVKTGKLVTKWMLGDCAEDAQSPLLQIPNRYDAIRGAALAGAWPETPPEFVNFTGPPKKEILEYLGSDLASLCWTCRRPLRTSYGHRVCGKCHTCQIVAEALE